MEKLSNFILKFYDKIIYIFSFSIILFLVINSFLFTSYMPSIVDNKMEKTYFYRDNIFISIIVLILFISLGVLIKKCKIKHSTKKRIINYFLILIGIVNIIWIFMANYSLRADSDSCFLAAKNFSNGN